jgi:hypothetical protein
MTDEEFDRRLRDAAEKAYKQHSAAGGSYLDVISEIHAPPETIERLLRTRGRTREEWQRLGVTMVDDPSLAGTDIGFVFIPPEEAVNRMAPGK